MGAFRASRVEVWPLSFSKGRGLFCATSEPGTWALPLLCVPVSPATSQKLLLGVE